MQTGILQYNSQNKSYRKTLDNLEKNYKSTQPRVVISHVVAPKQQNKTMQLESERHLKNMFLVDYKNKEIDELKEQPEDEDCNDEDYNNNPENFMEEQLKQAAKHFTSKDQLLPFIPATPHTEPEEIEPFSDDEEVFNAIGLDPNIDYEKFLDPFLGDIPR